MQEETVFWKILGSLGGLAAVIAVGWRFVVRYLGLEKKAALEGVVNRVSKLEDQMAVMEQIPQKIADLDRDIRVLEQMRADDQNRLQSIDSKLDIVINHLIGKRD